MLWIYAYYKHWYYITIMEIGVLAAEEEKEEMLRFDTWKSNIQLKNELARRGADVPPGEQELQGEL